MPPAPAAYHPSVPLHHQIQRVLRSKIESGEWAPSDRMPTEMALVERFRVSRATIREALASLTRDGLIVRHRGRGSFVASARATPTQAGRVTNLLLGYAAEIRVVAAETAPAPVHVAPWLHVERGERVKRFVRVEIVDGSPLAVVVNYMREALGHRIRPRDLTDAVPPFIEGARHEHRSFRQPVRSGALLRAGQDPREHRGRLS